MKKQGKALRRQHLRFKKERSTRAAKAHWLREKKAQIKYNSDPFI
jgi:hypothetical protein